MFIMSSYVNILKVPYLTMSNISKYDALTYTYNTIALLRLSHTTVKHSTHNNF